MQRTSLTPFGRQAVSAGLLATQFRIATAPALPSVDKWTVFNNVRTARVHLGVTDRDLAVLHALLSFAPGKELVDAPALVVHPSNATLSDRAHGMPESTLRRHLAALVKAGIILRHDSPNGKRYAARDAKGAVVEAYGFDLRPLILRAPEFAEIAAAVIEQETALRRSRTHLVLRLRDAAKLVAYAAETGLATEAFEMRYAGLSRALRRKMEAEHIAACLQAATELLGSLQDVLVNNSAEMSGNAALNERHYSESNTESHELEHCLETGRAADVEQSNHTADISRSSSDGLDGSGEKRPTIPLVLVLKACPDLVLYAPDPIRSWHDLVATAYALRPMIGISASAWDEAVRHMGAEVASLALAGILQRMAHIRSPGGYLRSLSAQAAVGKFSPGPMLMALLNTSEQRAA